MDTGELAAELLQRCVDDEQAVRRVTADADAEAVRREIRRLARARALRIRTARLGDAVVVVRTDARVWGEDAATMRRKLSPS